MSLNTGNAILSNAIAVDSSYNVGIGIATANLAATGRKVLDINGTTESLLSFSSGGTNKSYIFNDGTNLITQGATLKFQTGYTDRLTIADTGASTFSGNVDFKGETIIDGNNFYLKTSALNTDLALNYNGKTTASLIFYSGTTEKFKVTSSGAATFSSTITANDTYGLTLGSVANKRRIQYGSDVATSFTFLTDANGYAGLYAGSSFFTGSITSANTGFGNTGGFIINYGATAGSTSWRLANDLNAFGDFAIQQSTTQTGSTYASKLYISPSGNVGINTTSPNALLEVAGTSANTDFRVSRSVSSSTYFYIKAPGGDPSTSTMGVNGTDVISLTSSGQVAMGVTNPSSYGTQRFLAVASSAGGQVARFTDGANADLVLDNPTAGITRITAQYGGTGTLIFARGTGFDESMRIIGTGQVGINTSTFDYGEKLSLYSTTSYTLQSKRSGTGGEGHFVFSNGNGVVGTIFTSGTSTSYNTSSDYRLKEDLKEIKGLEKVSAIKVYDFKWKDNDSRMDGVIAHELAEVLPYAVNGEKDGEQMQGVDYSKIVPVLVKAIQEMNQTIQNQQQQINSLINR